MKALRTDNFRALCAECGISAKTGYKWRERLLHWGMEGLVEQSRRPWRHADQLSPEVVCEMVRALLDHQPARYHLFTDVFSGCQRQTLTSVACSLLKQHAEEPSGDI